MACANAACTLHSCPHKCLRPSSFSPSQVAGCVADADCECLTSPGTFSIFGQCADTSNGNQVDFPQEECKRAEHEQCGCNAAGACELRCMDFAEVTADEIVRDVLQDPNGLIEFRNVTASGHACFQRFERGHVMGYHADTNQSVSAAATDVGVVYWMSVGCLLGVC